MSLSVSLLFPGQGSQYVGMGENLTGKPGFERFEKADEILGFSLSKLMLEGPEEELKLTENTQPAILTHSLALYDELKPVLQEKNISIARVLGHSVGEYAALVAAGALSFEEALKTVQLRGKYMQEAVPEGKGKMIALLKVPQEKVDEACRSVSREESEVMPANYNEPNQIVISGEASACDRAVEWLEEHLGKPFRSVELKVSAPFHSSLMKPAAEKLKEVLRNLHFTQPKIPYIANVDAFEYGPSTSPATVCDNLAQQVDRPVLWTQSIEKIPADNLCLEVGPGKVLTGLNRKIHRQLKTLPLDNAESFSELTNILQNADSENSTEATR